MKVERNLPKDCLKDWKKLAVRLKHEVKQDHVSSGAAALAYYLILALFPALIFLLNLLPYLPIPNLDQAILALLHEAMPPDAANLVTGVVHEVTSKKQGGLLSFGFIGTLWASSNGMFAVMQQLNLIHHATEGRSFLKARGIAILLTILFGILLIGAFVLVVLGGQVQTWLASKFGLNEFILTLFAGLRWMIIFAAVLLGFELIYYLGPNIKQRFKWISPGSVLGVLLLSAASVGFRIYLENFNTYSATYGSLGAAIILLLWLYITGQTLLIGSEINTLLASESRKGNLKKPSAA
jgi:membrane protein